MVDDSILPARWQAMSMQRRISIARAALMVRHPFFGYLVMHIEPKEVELPEMALAATDGEFFLYDPARLQRFNRDELMGILAHEVWHLACGHIFRKGHRHTMPWLIATDIVVNEMMAACGLWVLPEGIRDTAGQFKGMSAEAIYNQLMQQVSEQMRDSGGSGKGNSKQDPMSGQGFGQSPDDPHMFEHGNGSGKQKKDETAAEQRARMEAAAEHWKQILQQAATHAKMQGNMPAGLESFIESVWKPKTDWKSLLREHIISTIRTDYTLIPPNKKYLYMPIYMPTLRGGESLEIVVAIDSSGSVNDRELTEFLTEVYGITGQFEGWTIHFITCDAAVHQYERLTHDRHSEWSDWPHRITGRGGTDFRPVFNYVEEHDLMETASCVVYLTDMYGSFPDDPGYPTIWLATSDVEAPFGRTIRLELDD